MYQNAIRVKASEIHIVGFGVGDARWLQIPDDPGHAFHVIPAGDSI